MAELAFEYRQEFHKDVVIDLVCYRRRGHNEGDDPSMTQPLMYNLIEAKRSVRKLYTEALSAAATSPSRRPRQALRDYQEQLERVFAETRRAGGDEPAADASSGTDVEPASSRRQRSSQTPAPRRRSTDRRSAPRSCSASATRTSTCPTASPCTPSWRQLLRASAPR